MSGAKPTGAHKLIGELPFCSVLTTNFESLIEQALPGAEWYTQRDFRGQQRAKRDGEFVIMKVHGDLRRPEPSCSAKPTIARRCTETARSRSS